MLTTTPQLPHETQVAIDHLRDLSTDPYFHEWITLGIVYQEKLREIPEGSEYDPKEILIAAYEEWSQPEEDQSE